ncbi:hypothetical protein D3C86_1361560 [compost metagenome]
MGGARGQDKRAAGIRLQKQRLDRADQSPGGGNVDVHDPFEDFRFDMANRRDDAENAGIGDENIKFAPALENIGAQRIDGFHVGEIEGNERRRAADGLDGVVQLLKAAHRAGAGDDMRAGLGKFQRGEIADAARSAGNESDAALEIDSHGLPRNDCASFYEAPLAFRKRSYRRMRLPEQKARKKRPRKPVAAC